MKLKLTYYSFINKYFPYSKSLMAKRIDRFHFIVLTTRRRRKKRWNCRTQLILSRWFSSVLAWWYVGVYSSPPPPSHAPPATPLPFPPPPLSPSPLPLSKSKFTPIGLQLASANSGHANSVNTQSIVTKRIKNIVFLFSFFVCGNLAWNLSGRWVDGI